MLNDRKIASVNVQSVDYIFKMQKTHSYENSNKNYSAITLSRSSKLHG